jgi:hypothetical protein
VRSLFNSETHLPEELFRNEKLPGERPDIFKLLDETGGKGGRLFLTEDDGVQHLRSPLSRNRERKAKLARIKEEIQAGTYETEWKLEIAITRLLRDLIG